MDSVNIFNISTIQEEKPGTEVAHTSFRSIEEFHILNRVDEGSYGVVYKAVNKKTGDDVALKHFKRINERTGFSIAAQRELDLLMEMGHVNIVTGHEIVVGSRSDELFLVMEYVPHGVYNLMVTMRNYRLMFGPEHVKCLMLQLLSAVQYLHDSFILHRDLKTNNILLTEDGVLKVVDFGMAREFESPHQQLSPGVGTLWYCAPELLLHSKTYSSPIDMWSVGCIFAELVNMQPLFRGTSQLNQLKLIFQQLGTPSENVWPGYSALPLTSEVIFDQHPPGGLRKEIKPSLLSDSGLSLLEQFLTYDPSRRITATEALLHPYFDEQPVAIEPAMFLSSLELEYVDMYSNYDMDDVYSSGFETEEDHSSYSGYPVGSSEYDDNVIKT
ncbi:unnamed protein product [Spodoptera littoralis]|uniref:Protein kinase domain-containing protein n=1 Tax=Spodoptera littoralis TaxID=7109 RepID=A0A9P0N2Z7_SPOLI|nr:unnamed protein product [Spodoptera littoralis]CAH1640572.1 unnamed protein product [Spodoptera littoralis]